LMSASGRLVAIVGAALTTGSVVAYVAGWAISAIRYAPDWNVGVVPLVLPLQLAVAGWVAWGALGSDPRRLLRNVLVAFALTFLLLYGWYFLLLGDDLMSVGNLLYLAAAVPLAVAAVFASATGGPRGSGGIRGEAPSRGTRGGARALGLVFFAAVAAVAGQATLPPVSQEARAMAPPERPSCPEYLDHELATFEGGGDLTTPPFDANGYWGYEYASTGYGTVKMTVLNGNGDAPFGTDGPFSAGDSVGGGEYARGGTLRLEIEADDDAKYSVVVCEGAGPSGANSDKPG
jgi:hypothetical protein